MGSGDVVSLHPSFDIDICAYEVEKHVVESGVKVNNLDVEAVIKLVKAGATKVEIRAA